MRLFKLFLLTVWIVVITIGALPTSSNENKPARRGVIEDTLKFFGYRKDDKSIGEMECTSDPDWRSSGFCAHAGPAFPKSYVDPYYAPYVGTEAEPEAEPAPAPTPAPAPVDPLEEPPITYNIPGGEDYTAPPGLPETWTHSQMVEFYTHVCITDLATYGTGQAAPPAPLLDEAGFARCNIIEGDLYDAEDEAAEVEEMAQELGEIEEWFDATKGVTEGEASGDRTPWDETLGDGTLADGGPGDGSPGGVTPENLMMSGAFAAGALRPGNRLPYMSPGEDLAVVGAHISERLRTGRRPPTDTSSLESIRRSPRWQRKFRRGVRKLDKALIDINMNGFVSMENAVYINNVMGAHDVPLISGPGPDDDPELPRNTPIETAHDAIGMMGELAYHPAALVPVYTWVPAAQSEFRDNWEHVKKLAKSLGTDNIRKAILKPSYKPFLDVGSDGINWTPKLLAFMALQGTMPAITPEFFAKIAVYGSQWIRFGNMNAPGWFAKGNKKFLKSCWKYGRKSWVEGGALGLIDATWWILLHQHHKHELKMAELGEPVMQRWEEPIKEGQGPWITTSVTQTVTILGEIQTQTMASSYQYYPASFTLSPSDRLEIEESVPTKTDVAASAAGILTVDVGPMTAAPIFPGISLPPTATAMPISSPEGALDAGEDADMGGAGSNHRKPRPRPQPSTLKDDNDDELDESLDKNAETNQAASSSHQRPRPQSLGVTAEGGADDLDEYQDENIDELVDGTPGTSQNGGPSHQQPRPQSHPVSAAEDRDGNLDESIDDTPESSLDPVSVHDTPENNLDSKSGLYLPRPLSRPRPRPLDFAVNSTSTPLNFTRSPTGWNSTGYYGRHRHRNHSGPYSSSWNATHIQSLGNANQSKSNLTSSHKGPALISGPRFLRGAAPWGGAVVPEVTDANPINEGNWACNWIPVTVVVPAQYHPGNHSASVSWDWNSTIPESSSNRASLRKRESVPLSQLFSNSIQNRNGTHEQSPNNATHIVSATEFSPTYTCSSPPLKYLGGTACWDGNVVPEIVGLGPNVDGNWRCQWIPYDK